MKSFTVMLQLVLLVGSVAANASALTFEQTWQKVVQQHPLVAAANNRLQAGNFDRQLASLRPNPRLTFEAENFYGSNDYQHARQAETALVAEQIIERGGKRDARRDLSEQKMTTQQLYAQRQLRLLRQQVREQFNQVLLAQERLQLTQSQRTIVSNNITTVTRLHSAGAATSDDVTRAQVQLQTIELQLTRARQQVANTSQRLAALWGDLYHSEIIEVTGPLLFMGKSLTVEQVLAPLDNGIDQKIAEQQVRLQQSEVSLERAKAKVDVTVAAGVRRFSASDEFAFTLGASVPLQIFNNNQAGIDGAYAQVRAAQHDADYTKRTISAEVLAALRRWQQAEQALTTLEKDILPATKSVLTTTRKAYERGGYSYLQVLDAQNSLLQAQRQRLELRTDAVEAMTILERYIEPLPPINSLTLTSAAPQEQTP